MAILIFKLFAKRFAVQAEGIKSGNAKYPSL